MSQTETDPSLAPLSELPGKGLSLLHFERRITLCHFPDPHRVAPLHLVDHLWYHQLHKPLPSISCCLPVQGAPMSISFSMNGPEGQCPGALGCSCRAEHPPGAPFSDAHVEEEQFRLRDVLLPAHRANL